jgi:hypothetical protein
VLLRARLPAEEGELVLAALEAARERVGEGVSAETPDAAGHGTAAVREAGGVSADTRDAAGYGTAAVREAAGVSAETRDVAGPGVVGSDDHEGVSAETSPRSAAELRADALVVMADAVLANGPAARSGGDRYQVVVHVDAPNLRGERGGRCETADGAPVAAETARRLACDASIVTMLEGDGTALNVGRKTRSIPPALRRALAARDRGCCFPGCTARRFVDAHHIEHWAHGGETKLGNLVQVCRHHHRLLHEGGYGVARERDGRLVFRRPDGRLIAACPAPPGARPGAAREWSRVDPEACVPVSAGDRLDLDLGVEAMLAFAPIRAGEPLGV